MGTCIILLALVPDGCAPASGGEEDSLLVSFLLLLLLFSSLSLLLPPVNWLNRFESVLRRGRKGRLAIGDPFELEDDFPLTVLMVPMNGLSTMPFMLEDGVEGIVELDGVVVLSASPLKVSSDDAESDRSETRSGEMG